MWLGVNLAALWVGLFPGVLLYWAKAQPPLPLSALRVLTAGQVGFLLLIYPLMAAGVAGRLSRAGAGPGAVLAVLLCEAFTWLAVAVPFWASAAYLSDATMTDAVRTGLVVLAAFISTWGLTLLIECGGGWMSVGLLVALVSVPGGLAANYLLREFLHGAVPTWLWDACPATFAWSAAASRLPTFVPQPVWAWLLWPAISATIILGRLVRKPDPLG